MNTVTLMDPQSGTLVHVRTAELPQKCSLCGRQLSGGLAMCTEQTGWVCVDHMQRVLMDLDMSPEFKAKAEARRQLDGAAPGDRTIVTRPLLVAVGLAGGQQ